MKINHEKTKTMTVGRDEAAGVKIFKFLGTV